MAITVYDELKLKDNSYFIFGLFITNSIFIIEWFLDRIEVKLKEKQLSLFYGIKEIIMVKYL